MIMMAGVLYRFRSSIAPRASNAMSKLGAGCMPLPAMT